jgi:hypothetical protein
LGNPGTAIFGDLACQLHITDNFTLGLSEDADTRQRTEDTVKRRHVNARGRRQMGGRPRTVLEQVGQSECRGNVDETRHPVSNREVQHDGWWRQFRGQGESPRK